MSDVNPLCPPRRRIGCVALIRNAKSEILLVQPDYKDSMILPGGGAYAEENPRDAVVREVREETGLSIQPMGVIALDYVRPTENGLEGLNLVFDGGHMVNCDDLEAGPEISGYAWLAEEDLHQHLKRYQLRRVRHAVAFADAGCRIPLLEHGHLHTGFEHTDATDEIQGS